MDTTLSDIEITVPAVRRAATLDRMLSSLSEHVVEPSSSGINVRVNIDPVGDDTVEAVERVVRKWCPDATVNKPESPSLNAAIRWLWGGTQAPVLLHIEDDVLVERDCPLSDLLEAWRAFPKLAYLQMARRSFEPGHIISDHNYQHHYVGNNVHLRSGRYKMSFGPGLVLGPFAREVAKLMHDECDPELQFHGRNPELQAFVEDFIYGTFCAPGAPRYVRDTGKPERDSSGWVKRVTERGTIWERCDNEDT